jgi:exonuclease SbcD
MRFLCTGDLHLGAGSDYGREPGERLAEQADVWQQIRRLAQQHDVQAILFAGDAFERRRPTPDELIVFHRELGYLDVVAVAGNHDVANADMATGIEVFESGMFTVFRQPGIHTDFGVEIACLPWTPVARLVAQNGGGDRDELHARAAELLLDAARDLRAQCASGKPAILMLHWSVSGASLPTGLPTDTLREPVIPIDDLNELGFDFIAAGHIHRRQYLRSSNGYPSPHSFYVGSPMPLNFGEANDPHGVVLLDTDEIEAATFLPIESRPFFTLEYPDPEMVEEDFRDMDRLGIGIEDEPVLKVKIHATSEQARKADVGAIRRQFEILGAHRVYAVELIVEREQRARAQGLDEGIGPLEALRAYVEASAIDTMEAGRMADRTSEYLQAVGS